MLIGTMTFTMQRNYLVLILVSVAFPRWLGQALF